MPTFFRHRKSECSTISNVQAGHSNWTSDQINKTGEGSTNQSSPTKRKANKATGKRTGGKPARRLQTPRGISLQTETEEEEKINNSIKKDVDLSSTCEDNISPSPERQNQKHTPPAVATRKSTRNRQAILAAALGNPIPISTIQIASTTGKKLFELGSPPEKSTQNYPSLKSLIQEMGFTDKTPEYKACVQFIEAISPKHKPTTTSNLIDLTSPTEAEDETMENNDILFVNTKDKEAKEKEDKQPQNDEEHGSMDENIDNNTVETRGEKLKDRTSSPTGTKNSIIFPRRGNVIQHG